MLMNIDVVKTSRTLIGMFAVSRVPLAAKQSWPSIALPLVSRYLTSRSSPSLRHHQVLTGVETMAQRHKLERLVAQPVANTVMLKVMNQTVVEWVG
jgi:hypothetical protein